jgi:hypothetical protein
MNPIIGTTVRDRKVHKVRLDPSALLMGHLLAVASSGGGKSWLIRMLLEQTFGLFPHLVIDVEGELKTLREKYDYIIASADGEGDCVADHRSAGLLARRLLELNASCIIDIYELDPDKREIFVRDFTKALISAPRSLWGPRLVVIDEAHDFAPEKGHAESKAAVCSLLAKGRKRGLGTVLASQRVAKLSKDAISECRNKMYGFCNLLADRKRATEDLGFIKKDDQELFRRLDTGHFYAVGPAISKREVIEVNVGKVKTTHPRPGENIQAHTPPPAAKVKKLLKELKDIPEQARQEIADLRQAKTEITRLRSDLTKERNQGVKTVDTKTVNAAYHKGIKEGADKAEKLWEHRYAELRGHLEVALGGQKMIQVNFLEVAAQIEGQLKQLKDTTKNILKSSKDMKPKTPGAKTNRSTLARQAALPPVHFNAPQFVGKVPVRKDIPIAPKPSSNGSGDYSEITGGARRLVEVLVRCHPAQFTKPQWASLADLRHTSGTFGTYLSKLRRAGLITEAGGLFAPSAEAFEWLGASTNPPSTNEEVVEMWKQAIGGTPAAMIQILRDRHPDTISREEIASELGITHTSGTFGTYLSKLRSNRLVEVQGQVLGAGEPLLVEP